MCRWVVSEREYSAKLVGPKALNLQELACLLPACVRVPPSFAVPFSALSRVLQAAGVPEPCLVVPEGSACQRSMPEDIVSYISEVCTHV
jgi:hypothetical protein